MDFLQYRKGDSLFHKLSPMSKLIYLLPVLILSLYFQDMLHQIMLFLFVLACVAVSGSAGRFTRQMRFFTVMLPLLLVFELIFHPNIMGLILWVNSSLRLLSIASAFILFSMTTNPQDIIRKTGRGFLGKTISWEIPFMLSLSMSMIPLIARDMHTIMEARKSRGIDFRKTREKITNYPKLLMPLLVCALERAQKQAIAMELKGFGRKKAVI